MEQRFRTRARRPRGGARAAYDAADMNAPLTVTAIVVAYGSTPLLERCVTRILSSEQVDVDVIIVDNGSTDGTAARAASTNAAVTLLDPGGNLGFGGGCNAAVAATRSEVVVFVNPDVIVEPTAIRTLVDELGDPAVGIASASVRLLDRPDLLNSSGGAIHFLGLGWAEGFEEPVASATEKRAVAAASGAAMAMRREVFEEVGGFLSELFLYHEDAELSLQCWLRGYEVRFVPDAVAHHDYEFGRNLGKLGLLERNRLIVVLTCYSNRMLLALAPALLAYELGIAALSISQGWWREKIRGWIWLIRRAGWLRARRSAVQTSRRRSDRELVPLFAERFTGRQVALPDLLRPADAALAAYWRAVRRWV